MIENERLKSAYNYARDTEYADGFIDGYKAGVKDTEPKDWIETDWAQVPVSEELKSAYFSGWVNAINYVIKHELFIEPKKGRWDNE